MRVYNNLAIILRQKRQTQIQLAEATGIKRTTLSGIVTGRLAPYEWEVEAITKALSLKPGDIWPPEILKALKEKAAA